MGLKIETVALSDISKEHTLRFDIDYITSGLKKDISNSIPFSDLFEIISKSKIDLDKLESFKYAEITDVDKLGDVTPITLDFARRDETTSDYFIKIEKGDIFLPETNDILISSVRPYLKKFVLVNKQDDIYYTKAFIQLRPKKNAELLYHTLRKEFFPDLIVASRQGKGYPTLKGEDLKYIRFNKRIIDSLFKKESQIMPKIKLIKGEIVALKNKIRPDVEIINEIFKAEFKWDVIKFNQSKSVHLMTKAFHVLSQNIDYRFSFKYHNQAGQYITDLLKSQTKTTIENYLDGDITLGKSISPTDYDDAGEHLYLSMADIKNWGFNVEAAKTVSQSYFHSNQNKTIAKNDIILARSGEGTIGKVAIIDTASEAVYADFTMRIRLKNYSPQFAYYYFRTDFFQHLIYTHKKGLGNNTNIFPSQIKKLPIPDISISRQLEVVKSIQTEIDRQLEIKKNIQDKIAQIEEIIETSIGQHS